jgi:hypothetical protein
MGAKVNFDDLPLCLIDNINTSCASCVPVKEQLHNALVLDQLLHFFKKTITRLMLQKLQT